MPTYMNTMPEKNQITNTAVRTMPTHRWVLDERLAKVGELRETASESSEGHREGEGRPSGAPRAGPTCCSHDCV